MIAVPALQCWGEGINEKTQVGINQCYFKNIPGTKIFILYLSFACFLSSEWLLLLH